MLDRAGLLHTTFAVVELQPSLFHRLVMAQTFPLIKTLLSSTNKASGLAKANKLKLPKQAQLPSRLKCRTPNEMLNLTRAYRQDGNKMAKHKFSFLTQSLFFPPGTSRLKVRGSSFFPGITTLCTPIKAMAQLYSS